MLVDTFGSHFVLPNVHSGMHFREQADLFGVLRNVWTAAGETKHLQFERWMSKMDCHNVQRDLMDFINV